MIVEQVMWQTTDMRDNAVGEFYGSDLTPEALAAYVKKVTMQYEKFEGWMAQRGTKFAASDNVTAADFHLFEMLDQHEE